MNTNRIEKPWGYEEILYQGDYLVKRLVLKDETSTHYHTVRTEHLFPVKGQGVVHLNNNVFQLLPNSVVRIDKGVIHKIVPTGHLEIIEISDINVDDVVRVENKHGRR